MEIHSPWEENWTLLNEVLDSTEQVEQLAPIDKHPFTVSKGGHLQACLYK